MFLYREGEYFSTNLIGGENIHVYPVYEQLIQSLSTVLIAVEDIHADPDHEPSVPILSSVYD